MTWLALSDHRERRLSLRGLGIDKRPKPLLTDAPDALLRRGTLMFETRLPADARPQVLLGYKKTAPHQRSLTFQAIPGGGIAMVQVQGDVINHAAVQYQNAGRTEVLRICYAWDVDYNWARLTLEQPGQTHVTESLIDTPCALTLDDIRELMLGKGDHSFAPEMIFAALSDDIEPIGPMPSLMPDTPLATPWGYKRAGDLQRGDTVSGSETGIVPVLATVTRTVPARGSFAPIRLRAPYFGLQQDIVVAPEQRLRIDGPEVEYLFGQEAVLVAARHLINGFAAREEPSGPLTRYTQLLMPDHETLIAAGTAVESLYIGRMCRDKYRIAGSLLHDLPQILLPEHRQPSHQVLQWYDAIHLARRRVA